MSDQPDIKTIQQWVDIISEDLYPDFLLQLQKDIYRAGIDYTIQHQKPKELFQELYLFIVEMMKYNFNDYISLLYAIDISEDKVKSDHGDMIEDLATNATFLILKREWQEVWLRKNL